MYLPGFRVVVMAMVLLGLCTYQLAQEFDTVVTSKSRKIFRIADQIEDPQERKAFLELYRPQEARERAKLAESFVESYPQSRFLDQVYETGAKAHIDLGDYERALNYAHESLRLLPENPVLLVLLANLQVQHRLLEKAKVSARNGLAYLDRFARPQAISETEWPDIQRRLRASNYYALARATMLQALSLPNESRRRELLEECEALLGKAARLNPADPEIAYLMALSSLSLGKVSVAIQGFATAYQLGGAVTAQALEQLRKIHKDSKDKSSINFETFLEKARSGRLTLPPVEPTSRDKAPQWQLPGYAGSDSCLGCHFDKHSAWRQTGMARMLQLYRPENVIGDFKENNEFYAGDGVELRGSKIEIIPGKNRFLFAHMVVDKGRHYFEIKHSDGRWVRYPVDYTIGVKWQQAYATRLPNGQIHVFPIQYNVLHKEWVNFWKIIDHPGSERADVLQWEKLGPATSYHVNCAPCHTSQLRNTKGGGFEPDHLEFNEPGINCEMCHGPSQKHVSAMMVGKPYPKQPLEPPVEFDKISSQTYIGICAQCHMQSALREPGQAGELNYSREDEVFFQRSKSRPFAEFSRKAFYKDGRFRETTFIVESLLRSACWKKGQVSCGHCHDPHGDDFSSNPTSLKFLGQPDQMCLQCHSEYNAGIEVHTGHSRESEGSRCLSCHMPRIMHSVLFKARTHRIDDIPNLEMTRRFGQEESPNACLICHSDKDTQWLSASFSKRDDVWGEHDGLEFEVFTKRALRKQLRLRANKEKLSRNW
ncbi:hypothetical protein MYX78_05530 [Acidobacteria bacterium AH-259-G07]|nr:hypothetical protein [Acidobacteria bacterium AH-259-G07]